MDEGRDGGIETHPGEVDLFDVFIVEECAVALQHQQMAVELVVPDTNNAVGVSVDIRVMRETMSLLLSRKCFSFLFYMGLSFVF